MEGLFLTELPHNFFFIHGMWSKCNEWTDIEEEEYIADIFAEWLQYYCMVGHDT